MAIVTLIAFVAAYAASSVSALHASCELELTVKDTDVKVLNKSLIDMVKSRTGFNSTCAYASEEGEFCGYKVVSLALEQNHFQHETPKAVCSPHDVQFTLDHAFDIPIIE